MKNRTMWYILVLIYCFPIHTIIFAARAFLYLTPVQPYYNLVLKSTNTHQAHSTRRHTRQRTRRNETCRCTSPLNAIFSIWCTIPSNLGVSVQADPFVYIGTFSSWNTSWSGLESTQSIGERSNGFRSLAGGPFGAMYKLNMSRRERLVTESRHNMRWILFYLEPQPGFLLLFQSNVSLSLDTVAKLESSVLVRLCSRCRIPNRFYTTSAIDGKMLIYDGNLSMDSTRLEMHRKVVAPLISHLCVVLWKYVRTCWGV